GAAAPAPGCAAGRRAGNRSARQRFATRPSLYLLDTSPHKETKPILQRGLQPAGAPVAVRLLHIDQHDPPAHRVADDLDLARILAEPVAAAVVLLLGELAHRLAAQLLERPADVAHVEEQVLLGGELRRRADAHPGRRAVAEADPPQAILAVGTHLARRLVEQI